MSKSVFLLEPSKVTEVTYEDKAMNEIRKSIRIQNFESWKCGDILCKFQAEAETGFSPLQRLIKDRKIPFSGYTAENLYKTAATFTTEDRDLDLPFAMYSYARRMTKTPVEWISLARKENWCIQEFYSRVRSDEYTKKTGNSLTSGYDVLLDLRVASTPCHIVAMINYSDDEMEPLIRVTSGLLTFEEATELREHVNRAVKEVSDYLNFGNAVIEVA